MIEGPKLGSLLNIIAGLSTSLRENALMLEGSKLSKFGSLLNVKAGLNTSWHPRA